MVKVAISVGRGREQISNLLVIKLDKGDLDRVFRARSVEKGKKSVEGSGNDTSIRGGLADRVECEIALHSVTIEHKRISPAF